MIKKRAKRYCIAAGCKNNDINSDHSFFHVPTNKKDAERVRKWLTLLGREDLLEKKELKRASHAVCGAHFEMSSIKTAIYLKDNAVPTMCLANQPNTSSSTQQSAAPFKSNRMIVSVNTEGDASSSGIPSTSQRKDTGKVSESEAEPSNQSVKDTTEPQGNKPGTSDQETEIPISLAEKAIRKRELSGQLKELKSKQREISREAKKIRHELKAKYKSFTYEDPDEGIARIYLKLVCICDTLLKAEVMMKNILKSNKAMLKISEPK